MSLFSRLASLAGAALLGGIAMGILAWLIGGSVWAGCRAEHVSASSPDGCLSQIIRLDLRRVEAGLAIL